MPIPRPAILALAFAAVAACPANANSCSVDLEAAYHAALAKGWSFACAQGVLTFDGNKRPGCFVKTGPQPSVRAGMAFFCKSGGSLEGGWRFESYKIDGGQWRSSGSVNCLVSLTFDIQSAFRQSRRTLSELRFRKKSGNCANALAEAF